MLLLVKKMFGYYGKGNWWNPNLYPYFPSNNWKNLNKGGKGGKSKGKSKGKGSKGGKGKGNRQREEEEDGDFQKTDYYFNIFPDAAKDKTLNQMPNTCMFWLHHRG